MNQDMLLNMDFEKVAQYRLNDTDWQTSRADGVSRIPLEREAAESGHTTSFVKFEPNSYFPRHSHPQGEELYVIEGVFSDEKKHAFNTESTALVWWPKNEVFQKHTHFGGEEVLVIKGKFIDEHGEYKTGSWIRSPHMSSHFPRVEEETLIMVKVGHLS